MQRAPTVNDLRIKSCYICTEEEEHDKPSNPPRRWVHPCKCSLVAHEQCLLEWIRTSENNPEKLASNILKCPQCGERYVMESNNPFVLKVMDNLNAVLTLCGHGASFLTLGSSVVAIGAGVYILLTSYGAFATHKFLGAEMYDLVLTDDPQNWPFHAFLDLPMIPLSLILSRTKRFRNTIPLIPLMMLWPSAPPVAQMAASSTSGRFLSFLGLNNFGRGLPPIKRVVFARAIWEDTVKDFLYGWPPSPLVFNVGLSLIRTRYASYLTRLRLFVLGDMLPGEDREAGQAGLRQVVVQNFRMEMRIEDEEVRDEGDNAQQQGQAEQQRPAPANNNNNQVHQLQDENNVRLVLDGAADDAQPRDQPPELAPPPPAQEQVPNPPRAVPAPNAPAGRPRIIPPANVDVNNNQAQGGNDNGENGDRARLRLRLTGAAFGSLVGGALLIPPIASFMGSVLLRLALPSAAFAHQRVNMNSHMFSPYSPRGLLCRFLAIRPPRAGRLLSVSEMYSMPAGLNAQEKMQVSLALVARVLLVGTPAWTESDPVWWRNTVGLGIFCVAKDLLDLWYLYLSQREIRTRRLKDRDFDGIDTSELDLRPELRGALVHAQV
ncbi:hypothetical protein DFH11DRAFT_1728903 [Phellopilus nigrolimitatus]|nr:hypothetical protein DFH11DRAFT_1728903 [Phellopilus nigrolimitatus]